MKKKSMIFVSIFILLIGCSSGFKEVYLKDIPIILSPPNSAVIRINTAIENVTPHIQEILPNAKLSSVVFFGECSNLQQVQGRITLAFVGTKFSIPQERIISIIASINIKEENMLINARDMTDYYWSTESLKFDNDTSLNLEEIATIAYKEITSASTSDCDVTLTRLDNSWDVLCVYADDVKRKCRFEIDARSGEIIPVSLD